MSRACATTATARKRARAFMRPHVSNVRGCERMRLRAAWRSCASCTADAGAATLGSAAVAWTATALATGAALPVAAAASAPPSLRRGELCWTAWTVGLASTVTALPNFTCEGLRVKEDRAEWGRVRARRGSRRTAECGRQLRHIAPPTSPATPLLSCPMSPRYPALRVQHCRIVLGKRRSRTHLRNLAQQQRARACTTRATDQSHSAECGCQATLQIKAKRT